jgi:hypothetical protein
MHQIHQIARQEEPTKLTTATLEENPNHLRFGCCQEGLDFILTHFEEPMWPRTISTRTTKGSQVLVYSKEEALARFKQANYLDCRISAYGPNGDENPHAVERFMGLRKTTPANIILLIDLDGYNFETERALRLALSTTLKNIREKLGINTPTVLWSGNGHHVILPIDAHDIMLENIKQFETVQQPSLKFLRFAEWFLSNGKSDKAHNNTVSFGNCMLRIPGSCNSKCLSNGKDPEVRIIQKWVGIKASIRFLLGSFHAWLVDLEIKKSEDNNYRKYYSHNNTSCGNDILWIEQLLQKGIPDYRKFTIWRILAPYLINTKKLSYEDAFGMIREWLEKCNEISKLSFSPESKIKEGLNGSSRGFFPISCTKLKTENEQLYNLLQYQSPDII